MSPLTTSQHLFTKVMIVIMASPRHGGIKFSAQEGLAFSLISVGENKFGYFMTLKDKRGG